MTKESEAIAILAEARTYKREAQRHRRNAQSAMQRLREFCEANGIEIEQIIVREDRDE